MRLRAIHNIWGKKTVPPGTVFEADEASAGRLLELGAAEEVEDEADADGSGEPKAKKKKAKK